MATTLIQLAARKPAWLKVPAPGGPNYLALKHLMRDLKLHTVCEEAHCPNIGECWEHRAATFMILGDVCTRNCAYCAVAHGTPAPLDTDEPARLAAAVEQMALQFATHPEIFERQLDALLEHDVRDQLGRLDIPTRVMCGRRDIMVPPELSEELASVIPGADLKLLEGGHAYNLEEFDAFNKTVLEFLKQH